jgi:hypothetical protein
MRRSSDGAAGGPHHTHTLDVHVEAGPKTEGRPPPVAGRRAYRPPPPPPPGPGSFAACMRGMHTRVNDLVLVSTEGCGAVHLVLVSTEGCGAVL